MAFNNQQEGGGVAVKDEGVTIAAKATSIDFAGAGVAGAAVGGSVTETIPGGTSYDDADAQAATGLPLTESSVPFAASTGKLSQDNQNFRWDNSVKELDLSASLASEKVTNGNMSSASGWTQGSPWSITGGKATHASNGTGALAQNVSMRIGERYVLSITVLDYTSGTLTVVCGGVTLTSSIAANGTYTFRFRATTTGALSITATNTARLSVDDVSVKKLQGGVLNVAGRTWMGERLNVVLDASNVAPGTTDHLTLENPSGGNTHIAASFGNTTRAGFSFGSNGQIVYRSGIGSSGYHEWQVAGTMVVQLTSGGIYDTGYLIAGGYVNANHLSASKSELNVKGRFARLYKLTDAAPYTIPSTQGSNQGVYYFDTTLASGCQGTITRACSFWTNSTDCALRDAHGGCSWFAGNPCSDFDGNTGSCSGTSGCSLTTSSCSGASDQSSCEAQDDAYGGSCAWEEATADCSAYNDDYGNCTGTGGCSYSAGEDCSTYDGTDEGTCTAVAGCSWNGSECQGSCSGSYGTGSFNCTGDYYTGGCTGTYGAACTGTSSCTGISADADCTGEAGCSIGSDQTVYLPLVNDVVDSSEVGAELHLMKWKGTGEVILTAQGSDKIGTGSATTKNLASAGDWAALRAWKETATCVGLNQANCSAQSGNGCTVNNNTCSWDSMTSECNGVAGCSAYDGDEGGCTSATFFSSCSGTYVVSRRWMDFS